MSQVPLDAQTHFGLVGPETLSFLVSRAGGVVKAARLAGVQPATLARWQTAQPRRCIPWYGYPAPLPVFDLVVGSRGGTCWLRDASVVGLERVLSGSREIGLDLLAVVPEADARSTLREWGLPSSTVRRYLRPVPWPRSLHALDRLSGGVLGVGWPEVVLGFDVRRRLQVRGGLLGALVLDLLKGVHRG